MTYATEEAAIRARLVANWSTTPIQWPNVVYDPAPATAYVRYTLRHGTAFQPFLNPGTERVVGVVILEVWMPEGQALTTVTAYVDTLTALFRRVTVSNLVFLTPSARETADQEVGWYRWIIECPYYRDEEAL